MSDYKVLADPALVGEGRGGIGVDTIKARALSGRRGFYVASRASIPERGAMWRRLRDSGVPINSSWIDEDGPGETVDFTALWTRVESEIRRSERLLLYAEGGDFPLKGALVEVGIALGVGVPVTVVIPGVTLEERSMRPLGSWAKHPLVTFVDTIETSIKSSGAACRDDTTRRAQF